MSNEMCFAPEIGELIGRCFTGELSEAEIVQLIAHIEECDACRDEFLLRCIDAPDYPPSEVQ